MCVCVSHSHSKCHIWDFDPNLHKFVTESVVFCDGLKPPRWRMQVFYAFMFLYLYVYIHGVQYLFFVYIHVL